MSEEKIESTDKNFELFLISLFIFICIKTFKTVLYSSLIIVFNFMDFVAPKNNLKE